MHSYNDLSEGVAMLGGIPQLVDLPFMVKDRIGNSELE